MIPVASSTRRARGIILLGWVLVILIAPAVEAGGVTGFLQRASPHGRPGVGLGLSMPIFTEIISIEGEYSRASEEDRSPSLTIWSGNVMIVSPISVVRLRPYFIMGLGMYRQSFLQDQETSLATSQGFGVYLHLTGPTNIRFDYRTIQLQGDPLQESQKRFYTGLTLRF